MVTNAAATAKPVTPPSVTWSSATVCLIEGVNVFGRRSRPVMLARDELTRTLSEDKRFQVVTRDMLTTKSNKDPKALATAFKALVKSECTRGLAAKKKIASSVKSGNSVFSKLNPASESDGSDSDSDTDSNTKWASMRNGFNASGLAVDDTEALALALLEDTRKLGIAPGRFVNEEEIIAAKEAMESECDADCIFVLCDYPAGEEEIHALLAGNSSDFPLDAVIELVHDDDENEIRDSATEIARQEQENAATETKDDKQQGKTRAIHSLSATKNLAITSPQLHGSKSRNALRHAISLPALQGQQVNSTDLVSRLRRTVAALKGNEKRGVLFLKADIFADDDESLTSRCKTLCFNLGAERDRFAKYIASCVTVTIPKTDQTSTDMLRETTQQYNGLLESMDEELVSVGVVTVAMANAVSLAHKEDPARTLVALQEEQAQLWNKGIAKRSTTSATTSEVHGKNSLGPTSSSSSSSWSEELMLPEQVLLLDFADDAMCRWMRVACRRGGPWESYAPANTALRMDRQAHSIVDIPGGRRRSGMPLEPAWKPELRGRRQTEFSAFSDLSAADVNWVEQLEHFEGMMCKRDPLQSTHWHFKDTRCFVEQVSPTAMDQLAVSLIASGHTFLHEYHAPSDKMLLAVHQCIPRGRRSEINHSALQFTDVSPSFSDWPLLDLGCRPVFYDVDLNPLKNVGGVTESLFPSDGSEIRLEKFADLNAWVSVQVDGDTFGMQRPGKRAFQAGKIDVSQSGSTAKSTLNSKSGNSSSAASTAHSSNDTSDSVEDGQVDSRSSKTRGKKIDMGKYASKLKKHRSRSTKFPAVFVAAFQDGSRLQVEDGATCLTKPDSLGVMILTYSCPNGLVVRSCSDGSVWQSYATSNLRGVPQVVKEESWRMVFNLGTVVRQMRDGRTIVMFADGTVAERASPHTPMGDLGFPQTPHFIPAAQHTIESTQVPSATSSAASIRTLAPQVKLDALKRMRQELWFVVSFTESHSCAAFLQAASGSSVSTAAEAGGHAGGLLKFKDDKTLRDSENCHCVTVDTSRDAESYDTTIVRSDGVVLVRHTSGGITVTHQDGTVIRSLPEAPTGRSNNIMASNTCTGRAENENVDSGRNDTERTKQRDETATIIVVSPGFAQIEINVATEATSKKHSQGGRVDVARGGRMVRSNTVLEDGCCISIEYDTRVTAKVNGFVHLKKPDGTDITVGDDGVVDCNPAPPGPQVWIPPSGPKSQPGDNHASSSTTEPRARASYLFDCSTAKLEVEDPEHNIFRIHDAVSPKLQSATLDLSGAVGALSPIVTQPRQPRLFVMNGDGSALELLQEREVGRFVRHASCQPGYHHVRCPTYHDVAFKLASTGTHTTLHRHMFSFNTSRNSSRVLSTAGGAENNQDSSSETRTVVVHREFAFVQPLDNNDLNRMYLARDKFRRYLETVELAQNQYDVQDPRASEQLRAETSMRRKINSERRKQRKRLEAQQRKQRAQEKLSHGGKRRGSQGTIGSSFSHARSVDVHKHDEGTGAVLLGEQENEEHEFDEGSSDESGSRGGEEEQDRDEMMSFSRSATPLEPALPLHPECITAHYDSYVQSSSLGGASLIFEVKRSS